MNESAWRDYWSGEGNASEALGGAHAAALAASWRSFFQSVELKSGATVVDIAAGAGAALAAAAQGLAAPRDARLIALDISGEAVKQATGAIAGARGVVTESAALPFANQSVDFVVSQFGIEYSGLPAFTEAARILKATGSLRVVCHLAGGPIETECARNKALIDAVAATGVHDAARSALKYAYAIRSQGDRPAAIGADEARFTEAARSAIDVVAAAPPGAARDTLQRFLHDLGRVSARRFAYREEDAVDWLNGMEASLSAYRQRMRSMCEAALGEKEVTSIGEIFAGARFVDFTARQISLGNEKSKAAWLIEAHRPTR